MPIDQTTSAGAPAAASPVADASAPSISATSAQSAKAARPAGYVPAFSGADGQEDPAPEAVVSSIALPHSAQPARDANPQPAAASPGVGGIAEAGQSAPDDSRFGIAEEVSTDLQTDQARRIGRLPQAVDEAGVGAASIPDPQAAVAATVTGKNPQ